ncbi:MAG: glycosyltransferase [Chlamydiae bacterium CG10_big_fil_rev_8_21_14_0_10_42_34]|nr:MAG: glycosyltransferase [Chlamydiae bacterium CG10_big_fil_rev_8_21_14_0_10_42_34]
MKTLTVILPVFNEEEVIETFYHKLKAVLKPLSYDSEILFVVDRSTDRTADILREISKQDLSVKVLILSSRFGHQMSLLAGIDYTNSSVVIMMDCDLQHPPELIPQMLQAYESGYDVVYTIRTETENLGLIQKLTSKMFYHLMNRISDTPINENAADFRLISLRVLNILKSQIRERNIFLRGIISWMGFNQIGIPFKANVRTAGQSKYPFSQRVKLGVQAVFSFSKKPLQASIFIGASLATLAFIFGWITCIQYFLNHSIPSGWTTIVILLSGFSGIQLFFMGIIGQYIGNIFDEVKSRPHYIVDEKINMNTESGSLVKSQIFKHQSLHTKELS